MAIVGRHAARAAVRRHPRAGLDELDQRAGQRPRSRCSSTSAAASTARRPTCRRRSMRRGGLLPKDLPNPPTYRKVNPADRAILIYCRLLRRAADLQGRRLRLQRSWRRRSRRWPACPRCCVAGQQDFAVRAQANPAALAAHGISLEDVRNALANATVNQAKGNLERRAQVDHASTPTTSSSMPRAIATSSSPIATARRSSCSDVANVIDATKAPRNGAWFNGKRGELLLVYPPARRQHRRGGRQHQGDDAAAARLGAAVGPCRSGVGPLAVDPRLRWSTSSSPWC